MTVKRSLDQLLKHRSSEKNFPIVVSQDCDHEPTRNIIQSYGDQITLISQPDQSDIELKGKAKKFKGYYKIARHYAWALNYTFRTLNYDTLIVVEDDLDIAPDFFEYFRALYPVLKTDETLYCISAWNDNGKEGLVANEPGKNNHNFQLFHLLIFVVFVLFETDKLYRSDFFPGLGWMLTKELWFELEHKWPNALVDFFIQSKNFGLKFAFILGFGMIGSENLNREEIEPVSDQNCHERERSAKKASASNSIIAFNN